MEYMYGSACYIIMFGVAQLDFTPEIVVLGMRVSFNFRSKIQLDNSVPIHVLVTLTHPGPFP